MTDKSQDIDSFTIRRARKGDMQAFATIYEAYGRRCYNLALRMSGSRAMAEDVVHDTFLKIMGRFRSYRGEASLWSWVRAITANTTINAMNQRNSKACRWVDGKFDDSGKPEDHKWVDARETKETHINGNSD